MAETDLSPCDSLQSLSIRSCPGFGSTSLAMVRKLCPQIHHLDLSGLTRVTDAGLLPLLEYLEEKVAPRANTKGQPNSEMICKWSCTALAKVAISESLGNIEFIK